MHCGGLFVPWCWCKHGLSCTLSGWLFYPVWPIVLWPSSHAVCSSGCGRTAADRQDAASAFYTAPGRPWGSPCMWRPARRHRTGCVADTSQTGRHTYLLLTGPQWPTQESAHLQKAPDTGHLRKRNYFPWLQGDFEHMGKRWTWNREQRMEIKRKAICIDCEADASAKVLPHSYFSLSICTSCSTQTHVSH